MLFGDDFFQNEFHEVLSRKKSHVFIKRFTGHCLYWSVIHGLVTAIQVLIALLVLVLSLVAGGDLHVPHALLTLDVAAPVELTLASLSPPLPPGGVTPVTAEQVTSIDALGSL